MKKYELKKIETFDDVTDWLGRVTKYEILARNALSILLGLDMRREFGKTERSALYNKIWLYMAF